MLKLSKNTRTRTSDQLLCRCGGEIKVVNMFQKGRLVPIARCLKCEASARKPSDLF